MRFCLLAMATAALLVPGVPFAAGLSPDTPRDPDGIRAAPRTRFQCGSGPELVSAMDRQHARAQAAVGPNTESLADQDIGNVAVVFDGGSLVFGGTTSTNAIVQQFYETHPDDFDYVAIFTSSAYDFDVQIESGFAFHRRVASDVLGIGVTPINRAGDLGLTTTRLRSILNLNDVLEYPPRFTDRLLQFGGDVEGVEVFLHEVGHQFTAFAEILGGGILGKGAAHWSFFMDSGASVMEGNRWIQNGGEFTSVETFEHFNQLDLYLMGILAPEDVTEPFFLIENPTQTGGRDATSFPEVGVTVGGTRRDVTVTDLVDAHGPRIPDWTLAPTQFRLALVLVVPDGVAPPAGDLDRLESFRHAALDWFSEETGGIGSLDTALPGVPLTADFEVEVFAGPAPLTISFQDRSTGPVTSWAWEFGDGAVSGEREPTHTYTVPGFYTVQLMVDGPGAPATRIRQGVIWVQPLQEIFHDDFEGPADWFPSVQGQNGSGSWVLDDPVGTSRLEIPVQPEDDFTADPGSLCWVTGNLESPPTAGGDDVDSATVLLESGEFDLSGVEVPIVEYALWYSNNLGGGPGTDVFQLQASNDGGQIWVTVDSTRHGDRQWRIRQIRLGRFFLPGPTVHFRFVASDLGPGSLVEAAVDEFRIRSLSGFSDEDGDSVPDLIDNCIGLVNFSQSDWDQDGFGTPCDCDDAVPTLGGFVGNDAAVEALPVAPGRFQWTADPLALDYNVYRGVVLPAVGFLYNQTCFEKRSLDTETFDPAVPGPGELFFYLVAPRNECGEADLGLNSGGGVRPLSAPCPPPITPG